MTSGEKHAPRAADSGTEAPDTPLDRVFSSFPTHPTSACSFSQLYVSTTNFSTFQLVLLGDAEDKGECPRGF